MYSGEDGLTYSLYGLGANGVVSVTANVAPDDMAEQYNSFKNGDMEKAKEIHYKLLPLHEALFLQTNPIPVKAALSMMGLIEEDYRLPLVKMDARYREELKEVLKNLGKIF